MQSGRNSRPRLRQVAVFLLLAASAGLGGIKQVAAADLDWWSPSFSGVTTEACEDTFLHYSSPRSSPGADLTLTVQSTEPLTFSGAGLAYFDGSFVHREVHNYTEDHNRTVHIFTIPASALSEGAVLEYAFSLSFSSPIAGPCAGQSQAHLPTDYGFYTVATAIQDPFALPYVDAIPQAFARMASQPQASGLTEAQICSRYFVSPTPCEAWAPSVDGPETTADFEPIDTVYGDPDGSFPHSSAWDRGFFASCATPLTSDPSYGAADDRCQSNRGSKYLEAEQWAYTFAGPAKVHTIAIAGFSQNHDIIPRGAYCGLVRHIDFTWEQFGLIHNGAAQGRPYSNPIAKNVISAEAWMAEIDLNNQRIKSGTEVKLGAANFGPDQIPSYEGESSATGLLPGSEAYELYTDNPGSGSNLFSKQVTWPLGKNIGIYIKVVLKSEANTGTGGFANARGDYLVPEESQLPEGTLYIVKPLDLYFTNLGYTTTC